MKSIVTIITTYNNENCISKLLDSIEEQNYEASYIVIADDGSTDKTKDIIKGYMKVNDKLTLLPLVHGERGIARAAALKKTAEINPDFICILDSDMVLNRSLFETSMKRFQDNSEIGAMVLEENPFSEYNNLATKVKVFERKIINNSGEKLDANSIEAARIWRYKEFLKSGGINPDQISFEETQPTIRYRENGGKIIKLTESGLEHDEKHVTVQNLFGKKNYHFKMMGKTLESESNGFLKAFKRWYFFRPVMYRKENMKMYIKHPGLATLMVMMYLTLTGMAATQIVVGKLARK